MNKTELPEFAKKQANVWAGLGRPCSPKEIMAYADGIEFGYIYRLREAWDELKNLACDFLPDVALLFSKQGNEGEARPTLPACVATK